MAARGLGVVDVVYGELGVIDRVRAAARDGFDHIDVGLESLEQVVAAGLLPVGCPTSFPRPTDTWCATPAPRAGEGMWERAVRWWRAAPHALLEPWAGSIVGTTAAVRAFVDEVPGLRLLVDTGHVADWGGDPLELLDLAAHVQLRQGAPGRAQLPPDAAEGVVDFAAVLGRLDDVGYTGVCSIEYFDLPEHGWPLEDPRGHAVALRDIVRRLAGS